MSQIVAQTDFPPILRASSYVLKVGHNYTFFIGPRPKQTQNASTVTEEAERLVPNLAVFEALTVLSQARRAPPRIHNILQRKAMLRTTRSPQFSLCTRAWVRILLQKNSMCRLS